MISRTIGNFASPKAHSPRKMFRKLARDKPVYSLNRDRVPRLNVPSGSNTSFRKSDTSLTIAILNLEKFCLLTSFNFLGTVLGMATTVVHCKKSPFDVYIGRPSKWGNPFVIGKDGTRQEVITKYKMWIRLRSDLYEQARTELKGKILGCFCAPLSCHGDVLAEIANS